MPDTAVELEWANGRYRFWLPMPQLLELERACGQRDGEGRLHPKSIFAMFAEMSAGMARASDDGDTFHLDGGAALATDINEVVRLGLIGGATGLVRGEEVKVGALTAKQLVADYGYPATDLGSAVAVAWAVLNAAINGVRLKKKAADEVSPALSEKATS